MMVDRISSSYVPLLPALRGLLQRGTGLMGNAPHGGTGAAADLRHSRRDHRCRDAGAAVSL